MMTSSASATSASRAMTHMRYSARVGLELIQSALIRHLLPVLLSVLLGACATTQPTDVSAPVETIPSPPPSPRTEGAVPERARPVAPTPSPSAASTLKAVEWTDLPNWREDDHSAALKAFVQGCAALGS